MQMVILYALNSKSKGVLVKLIFMLERSDIMAEALFCLFLLAKERSENYDVNRTNCE